MSALFTPPRTITGSQRDRVAITISCLTRLLCHLSPFQTFQAPSAKVPDQEHPEKYMNFDTAWLDTVVHHNLWYKDTKAFKHHKHGEKKKVIPHLHHHPA